MGKKTQQLLAALAVGSWTSQALAAGGGGVTFISYYGMFLNALGVHDHHLMEDLKPLVGAAVTLLITVVLGLMYRSQALGTQGDQGPSSKFGLRSIVEMIAEFVHDLGTNAIGPDKARPYLPVLFGVFFFILISNLTGLVPGFTPATESINTNLVLGLFIFLVFNWAGIKEHGFFGYLRTYAGPVLWMMPFLFAIEIIGMMARPLSLSLRLYGNIFGDHLVLSVFTGLTKLVFPSFLLFFGLLVACLQSFVFTLLSSIYISLATSHDH
ncbi:MAG TPA: F0F1 ATP synthase subunit A [Oligoflexus sp.]|uniref:F0F1 ATP synthase subunit A n=1 Tax=Oligoflexus sp. TaxID=1971216 RepID=UPI002D384E8C|nr:F0F1 ATP synthase subunit A [Oligoflexus sp.]HYX35046.1 F0F1 ATP synthase subunit A [Oligoflexus sp.]